MVKVITVGCRLNQAEGDRLTDLKIERLKDYKISNLEPDNLEFSNLVIVNTCAVTHQAARTSWKMIRRTINSKIENQNTKLIVTGCLASLERDKLLNTPGIDAVIAQQDKITLLDNIQYPTPNIHYASARSRPVVKIQDGCPNECSFCIARIIRGRPKSVPTDTIIEEINHYINLGYQEIVLTGLNLGCYGIDNGSSLTKLIKSLNNTTYRVRLSSIEPDTITDELLNLWQTVRLCRHLHIPLQSGDDRLLKLMRRKYTVGDFCKLVDKIVAKISGINIGTDIIVGFPYEDESIFNNTLKLVEKLPFGYLHVFPYSCRNGTESAKFPDTVPNSVKKERVRILREVAVKKKQTFRQRFINTDLEVLVEDNNIGLSDNYIRIQLPQSSNYQKGQLSWFKTNN